MPQSNFTNSSNSPPFLNPPAPKNSSPNVALYGATGVAIFLFCGFVIYQMLKSRVNRVANSEIVLAALPPQPPATAVSTLHSPVTGIGPSNRTGGSINV